jgi:hypothetical protein
MGGGGEDAMSEETVDRLRGGLMQSLSNAENEILNSDSGQWGRAWKADRGGALGEHLLVRD